MLGIDSNFQRRTFRVRDLIAGQVTMRQAIICPPTADAGEAVSSDTATKGGGGGDTGITRLDSRKPLTTRLYWGDWRPSRSSWNRNSMSRRRRAGQKVRLRWKEWSIGRRKFSFRFEGGNFGGARTGKNVFARAGSG